MTRTDSLECEVAALGSVVRMLIVRDARRSLDFDATLADWRRTIELTADVCAAPGPDLDATGHALAEGIATTLRRIAADVTAELPH